MAYEPTNWQTGDVITAAKLNNIESWIDNSEYIMLSAQLDGVANKWYISYSDITNYGAERLFQAKKIAVLFSVLGMDLLVPIQISTLDAQTPAYYGTFFSHVKLESWISEPTVYYFDSTQATDDKIYLEATSLESQDLIVTLTPTAQDLSGTMDTTPQVINAAIMAGRNVVLRFAMDAHIGVDVKPMIIRNDGDPLYLAASIIYAAQNMLVYVETNANSATYSTTLYPLTSV